MNRSAVFKHPLIGLLILLLAAPSGVLGQESGKPATYKAEELNQMIAPIALYPDSLLANVLVAATFPLEVVAADRWVKQNKGLKGDQLNAALDKMRWDLSVKALAPFPQVLAMMSEQLEWTQALGNAFLAQQSEVMATVQKLRAKAQAEGNLKSTQEQKVEVKDQSIVIEPANPTVVYVPTYNPTVIYGAWPYPAYPPYAYYPYGGVVAAGVLGFAAGVAVGAAWNNGWGSWNWHGGSMNVNVNRNVNINSARVSHYQTGKWNQGARNGSVATRPAAWSGGKGAAGRVGGAGGVGAAGRVGGAGSPGRVGGAGGAGSPGGKNAYRGRTSAGAGASARPTTTSARKGYQQRGGAGAFQGMGSAGNSRLSSNRGMSSRQGSPGGFGGGRGGHSGGGGAVRGGGGGGRRR